ncbi:type 2 lanthipeptide synthetase LanM family protein [Staphylococcus pasteuri]|uniref:type 2 lanthipeptide synthetase LanM family protein n=1 Tax=Staphylococcus pasteuri TaxID=45972 RepID=UPI002DB5B6A9|nr:type 2 lanthipeptide synthetase LanM family protein [Staphylococcus pasteuri]MEB6613501.1 type 2 lanthipeptide synthetase LanM family protein [Staphylococcus pasteuri]
MIKNLYNAFTIEERKQLNTVNNNIPPIKNAYIYWNKLLNNDLDEVLKIIFKTNKKFIDSNYSLENTPPHMMDIDWIQILSKINFTKNYTLKNDETYQNISFYPFFKPFLNYYRNSINQTINNIERELLSQECMFNLEQQLLESLLKIAQKTLILEINYISEKGRLIGNTPEQRYQAFCDLIDSNFSFKKSMLEEYPVLFRLLTQKTQNYINNIKYIISNFNNDKSDIIKELDYNFDKNIKITNISMDSGDTHNNQSVSTLTFNNFQKLIFKPRDMSIDIKFNSFIEWLNNHNRKIVPIKTAKVLNKKNYGWSENISFDYCNNKNDIKTFYKVLGEQLAVLYLLNTTDIHYENIICSKNRPVLIDMETLFHHTLINDDISISPSLSKAADLLNNSVLSTGILPLTTKGFDLSGTGNTENKTIPFEMENLQNSYTDNIKIKKEKNTVLKPGENHPKIKNNIINITDYVSYIVDGFYNNYEFFLQNKSSIEKELTDFKGLTIRKIFRNTQQYSSLLDLSYHPDFLRNQIDRDFLFARLYQDAINDNSLTSLISQEINQLNEGNIPFFNTLTNSKDIYINQKKLSNFFQNSGYKESIKKLHSLSWEDYYFQENIIKGSLLGVDFKQDINISKLSNNSPSLLEKAESIADLLLTNSVKKDNEMCWISMAVLGEDEENVAYSITGHGLYDGNPGMCLLFTYLFKLTNKYKYKEAAYRSLKPIKVSLKDIYNEKNFSIGPFMGLSGYIYVCDHMSHVFSDESLLKESIHYSEILTEFIQQDKLLDIIGGASGALIVLINLYRRIQTPHILESIHMLKNHIINNMRVDDEEIHWPIITSNKSYIGFSHGTSGIVAALSYYYKYINNDEYILEIISKGIESENKQYNNNFHNWFSDHTNNYTTTWCHGSSGILLSRFIVKNNICHKINTENDINNALISIFNRKITPNYSLCHGELGNLDILLYIKENDKLCNHKISKEIERSISNLEKNLTNIRGDINTIGLMGGITGLAYGLLRILQPGSIPSINSLESVK